MHAWARVRAWATARAHVCEGEGEGAATTAANDDAEEDDAEGAANVLNATKNLTDRTRAPLRLLEQTCHDNLSVLRIAL